MPVPVPSSPAVATNLYDSGERAYAAKMRQFASQPLERAKRRRSSGASSLRSAARAATSAPAHTPAPPGAPSLRPAAVVSSSNSSNQQQQQQRQQQHAASKSVASNSSREAAGVDAVAFRVHRASGAAGSFQPANLLEYSTRSCWQSFSRVRESVVLALDAKTLLSEIRILNKNACAVDVSVAVDDRPRSYVAVKRVPSMAHAREVSVRIGFIPCRFVRLEFTRHSHASIAVHGVLALGVPCSEIEDGAGPSLCNLLSHATENLLFGSSLRASQPCMDFLSDHRSGSPEWMLQHRTHLLDEKIARLEAALFA